MLDEDAYHRFWRSYHGFATEIRHGDIERLGPLWKLLAERELSETLKNMEMTVQYLLSAGKFAEGLRLAGVIRNTLKSRPRFGTLALGMLKGAVKAVLPGRLQ